MHAPMKALKFGLSCILLTEKEANILSHKHQHVTEIMASQTLLSL